MGPILKRKEIIKCMRELQIPLTDNDLKVLHEEKCKIVYASILEKLTGQNVLTQQIPYDKLTLFEYPSLHDSSITSIRLFRELIKFMQSVGVSDFSISDLISPDSSRTIHNLSAIINFARWREQKYHIYQSKVSELNALNEKWVSIKSENERLAEEFVQMTKQKNLEKPEIDNLQSDIYELEKNLSIATAKYDELGNEGKEIKKSVKNLEAAYSEKVAILNKQGDVIHALSRNIVRSPMRIKKELRFLSNKIEKSKHEINEQAEALKCAKHREEQLKILSDLVNERVGEMKRIYVLKGEHEKYVNAVRGYQTERSAVQKELNSIMATHKVLKKSLNSKKSEFDVLSQEHEAKKSAISMKNEEIIKKRDVHSRKRIAKQSEIVNIDRQIEETKDAMERMFKENKNKINELCIRYKRLSRAVSTYHDNMRHAIKYW